MNKELSIAAASASSLTQSGAHLLSFPFRPPLSPPQPSCPYLAAKRVVAVTSSRTKRVGIPENVSKVGPPH